jgi:Rieske Fe-S protein
MKTSHLLAVAAGLLLAGCGEKSNPPAQGTNTTSAGNPLTAPVDYLDAAAKAKQSAVKTVDVTSLNQAIQMFNVEKGRNPKDLNELVTEKFIPRIPDAPYGTRLEYDAASGKVTVVKQ